MRADDEVMNSSEGSLSSWAVARKITIFTTSSPRNARCSDALRMIGVEFNTMMGHGSELVVVRPLIACLAEVELSGRN